MSEVKLNTWERTMLAQCVGIMRGDVATIRRSVKLLDKLDLGPEEADKVGLRLDGNEMRWADPVHEWTLDFTAAELAALKAAAESFQHWGPRQAAEVFALIDKLTPAPKE